MRRLLVIDAKERRSLSHSLAAFSCGLGGFSLSFSHPNLRASNSRRRYDPWSLAIPRADKTRRGPGTRMHHDMNDGRIFNTPDDWCRIFMTPMNYRANSQRMATIRGNDITRQLFSIFQHRYRVLYGGGRGCDAKHHAGNDPMPWLEMAPGAAAWPLCVEFADARAQIFKGWGKWLRKKDWRVMNSG